MEHSGHEHDPNLFPTDPVGLPPVAPSPVVHLADGDHYALTIAPVAATIGADRVRMLAYNGSVPGPSLRVRQHSQITVPVTNHGDTETTVHWHGLRVANRFDGTPETQASIPVGGSFTYQVRFPDPGGYWYHPHVREDYNQELGLYATIVVAPEQADYWPPVHRELTVTLDDILVEHGRIAPFDRDDTNYAAMGRYGNTMLTNGHTHPDITVGRGEVVRFYFVDVANTRTFDIAFPGARMKLVGGDSGHYEHEQLVDNVIIAPSERAVVDVCFDRPGHLTLQHRTPEQTYDLATITLTDEPAEPELEPSFGHLRTNADMVDLRRKISPYFAAEPDKTLALVARMTMHEPGHHAHMAHHDHHHHHTTEPIEWEDNMVAMNRATTTHDIHWELTDRATGAAGADIDWQFRVGDKIKIRLVDETDSDHPMQHPIHIHGAGRFLVLSRNGDINQNLVWKDTVLVPTGETTDILLDITTPGIWMIHCHIAEHMEAGMMFNFTVEP